LCRGPAAGHTHIVLIARRPRVLGTKGSSIWWGHYCVTSTLLGFRAPGLIPYPYRVVYYNAAHFSRKLDLVNRTKKIIGQLESVLRGLHEDEHCADVLQRLAAARGAINSLMAELMEDHIRNHMPRNSKSSEEAAEDVIEIVKSYLK
jgi:DNA-binding FrmR family transcriptional regulator